jgi:hypothetical protein
MALDKICPINHLQYEETIMISSVYTKNCGCQHGEKFLLFHRRNRVNFPIKVDPGGLHKLELTHQETGYNNRMFTLNMPAIK